MSVVKKTRRTKKSGGETDPEIVKTLGNGVYGITYLAKQNNEFVAFKKAHILKSDIDNKHSRYHAMLAFYEQVANKYPGHFTQLVSHKIVDNCNLDFKAETNVQAKKEVHESPFCLFMVTKPVLKDTLKNWYNDFVIPLCDETNEKIEFLKPKIKNEIYSFLAQYVYIYWLMEMHGWIHADSKWKNVMYLEEKQPTILLDMSNIKKEDESLLESNDQLQIPSFGKRWFLIDYDPMHSEKFYDGHSIESGAWKTVKKSPHVYLIRTLEYLLFQPFWKPIIENEYNINRAPKTYELIVTEPKTKYIKDLLPSLNEYDTLKECAIALAIALEPEAYFRYLKLDEFLDKKTFNHYLNLTKSGQYFDPSDLKYFIKHLDQPELIVRHLAGQLGNKYSN